MHLHPGEIAADQRIIGRGTDDSFGGRLKQIGPFVKPLASARRFRDLRPVTQDPRDSKRPNDRAEPRSPSRLRRDAGWGDWGESVRTMANRALRPFESHHP